MGRKDPTQNDVAGPSGKCKSFPLFFEVVYDFFERRILHYKQVVAYGERQT